MLIGFLVVDDVESGGGGSSAEVSGSVADAKSGVSLEVGGSDDGTLVAGDGGGSLEAGGSGSVAVPRGSG